MNETTWFRDCCGDPLFHPHSAARDSAAPAANLLLDDRDGQLLAAGLCRVPAPPVTLSDGRSGTIYEPCSRTTAAPSLSLADHQLDEESQLFPEVLREAEAAVYRRAAAFALHDAQPDRFPMPSVSLSERARASGLSSLEREAMDVLLDSAAPGWRGARGAVARQPQAAAPPEDVQLVDVDAEAARLSPAEQQFVDELLAARGRRSS